MYRPALSTSCVDSIDYAPLPYRFCDTMPVAQRARLIQGYRTVGSMRVAA